MASLEELQNAGLPAIIENDTITFSRSLTDPESETYHDILDPTRVTKRNEDQLTKQQLKTEYTATITQLEQIESATNPTNAQVIAALKFLAKTIKIILKLLAYRI